MPPPNTETRENTHVARWWRLQQHAQARLGQEPQATGGVREPPKAPRSREETRLLNNQTLPTLRNLAVSILSFLG